MTQDFMVLFLTLLLIGAGATVAALFIGAWRAHKDNDGLE